MQRPLNEFPAELLLLLASKTLSAKTISSLMQSSKALEKQMKEILTTPRLLLNLLSKLPQDEVFNLLQMYFQPGSPYYQAIEKARMRGQDPAAVICHALITDKVGDLDWAAIANAKNQLDKVGQMDLSDIYAGLDLTKAVVEDQENFKKLDGANVFVNLSGLSFDGTRSHIEIKNLNNINFYHCVFPKFCRITLEGAGMHNINFRQAEILINSIHLFRNNETAASQDFSGSCLRDILVDYNFSNAKLRGANLGNLKLVNVDLSGADMRDVKFYLDDRKGAVPTAGMCYMVSFEQVKLTGAKLDGARFIPDVTSSWHLEKYLSGFQNFKFPTEADRLIFRQAVLNDILTNVKDPKSLQVAQDHEFFQHQQAQLLRKGVNWIGTLFSKTKPLTESRSQELLREKKEKILAEMKVEEPRGP